jgi:membrane glycosyltransferase
MSALPAMMPSETPIAMPPQRFDGPPPPWTAPEPGPGRVVSSDDMLARRIILVLMTGLLATAASSSMQESLLSDGFSLWDGMLLMLFFPLFAWIAFGFMNAAIGFALLISGSHPGFVPTPRQSEPLEGRTAILMPVHNEDIDAVFERIAWMARAIADGGVADRFDFFILSDSSDAAEATEVRAWQALAPTLDCALYYRRRTLNVGRKPGNVAEWIRRFGGGYRYMLMLDADSLMGGNTIIGMAQVLERRPAVALLQTVPAVINGVTFFQRWMQFASRLYGPISTAGLVWWSGSEATFWGHNALIRIEAFASSCGLPDLPGRAPFGGVIMSHDMVEAALLRRRGWRVHMLMTEETFEEYPPTLIDAAVRDRRWAQGNIQHLSLLSASGFHWINRLQLLMGASAFITSPVWLLMIATSVMQALIGETNMVEAQTSLQVLIVTLLLLFGPKILSVTWAMSNAERRTGFGGARGIMYSVLVDVPFSMLSAPVIALTQTIDLAGILVGRKSGWAPQNRDAHGLSLRDVMPRYQWHVGVGVAMLFVTPFAPITAAWLAPVTLGLLLSPFLAMLTASEKAGRWALSHGMFMEPGEHVSVLSRPSLPARSV